MKFSVVELFVALAHYGNFLFILMTSDTMVIWFMLLIVKIYGYWDRLPFDSWCQVFIAIYTSLCCFLSMEKGDTFRGLLASCFETSLMYLWWDSIVVWRCVFLNWREQYCSVFLLYGGIWDLSLSYVFLGGNWKV